MPRKRGLQNPVPHWFWGSKRKWGYVANSHCPAMPLVIRAFRYWLRKVSKGAKIRNRYNPVPHLTQDTSGKVTNSQLDTTNESQEINPFSAGDHKAHIYRRVQTQTQDRNKHERSTKEVPP